jgi:hypothetical protein
MGTTRRITFDTVREIGEQLPGTEVGTAYGSPALKVNGRIYAGIAINKEAEPNSLGVYLADFEQREALLAEDPDTYYVKPHYVALSDCPGAAHSRDPRCAQGPAARSASRRKQQTPSASTCKETTALVSRNAMENYDSRVDNPAGAARAPTARSSATAHARRSLFQLHSRPPRQRLPSSLVIEGVSALASRYSFSYSRRDTSDNANDQ